MQNWYDTKKTDKIAKMLLARKQTIAVAESVTAGYLQAALASADNAIQFFQGGLTAYNLGQKCRHLTIEPIHAVACNCVSAQVAKEMALNVCTLFQSHWGVGITGYASPVPESDNQIFCFYAVAAGKTIKKNGRISLTKQMTAMEVQQHFVNTVLTALDTVL